MKREDLFKYIGDVDDRFVEELFEESPAVSRQPSKRRGLRMIAASLALVLIGTAAMLMTFVGTDFGFIGVDDKRIELGMTKNSIVMLDVNPSIMFEVNDRNIVVKYEALNDDAKKLKTKLDVIGKDCNEAIELTLKVLNEKKYLTDLKNSVLITVVDKDTNRATTLRNDIVTNVELIDDTMDLTLSILSLVLDDGTQYMELADEYNVSVGKMTLVERIIETNQTKKALEIEQLVGSSIHLLDQLLTYVDLPTDVQHIGEVNGVVPESQRRNAGVDELTGDELMNFIGAVSDFFDKLADVSGEKELRPGNYDLWINKDQDSYGSSFWTLVAKGEHGSHGAVINSKNNYVNDFRAGDTVEGVLKLIYTILGSDPN